MPLAMSRPWKHPDSGVYWLRKGVPEDLRALVGKREEKRSLGTRDPIEAKRRHAEALAEIEERWANLRSGPKILTEREAHQLAMVVHDRWLQQHVDNPSQQTAWNVDLADRVFAPQKSPKSYDFLYDVAQSGIDRDRFQVLQMEEWCLNLADEFAAARGLVLNDAGRRVLAVAVAAALQRASLTLAQLAKGSIFSNNLQLVNAAPASRLASSQSPFSLIDLVKGWAAERRPAAKTLYEWSRVVNQLKGYLGHDDARRLTAEDFVGWKQSMVAAGLRPKTIQDAKLAPMRAILQWGVQNKHIPLSPDVVHNVVHGGTAVAKPRTGRPRRAPSYLVHRLSTYFFQIRPPRELAPGSGPCAPIRVRLGVLPKREAQRRAAWLGTLAQAGFGEWRRHLEGYAYSEFPHSDVGFPKGDNPEEFLANMMTFLKGAAAKLENPAPTPVFSPAAMRDLAAIQEAVLVEQEVKKGDAGHPTVTAHADLLRKDIWDRWRAGEGLPPLREPLTDAIGRLAEVADRQLALLQQATMHQPVTIHRPVSDLVDRPIVQARRDPPAALPEQPEALTGTSPLFSQIEDQYISIRENGGASAGTISTARWRTHVFKTLAGDRPIDQYMPIDLQNYVNELQYLPLQFSRKGDQTEELLAMGIHAAIARNKTEHCYEPIALKTMQDGYVQIVRAISRVMVARSRLRSACISVNFSTTASIRWRKRGPVRYAYITSVFVC